MVQMNVDISDQQLLCTLLTNLGVVPIHLLCTLLNLLCILVNIISNYGM